MKKTNVKTKVIAGIMAAICSVSALGALSAVGASAAVVNSAPISAQAASKKVCLYTAFGKTSYGYDWDYRASGTSAKISCTYDFKTNKYTFKAALFLSMRQSTASGTMYPSVTQPTRTSTLQAFRPVRSTSQTIVTPDNLTNPSFKRMFSNISFPKSRADRISGLLAFRFKS